MGYDIIEICVALTMERAETIVSYLFSSTREHPKATGRVAMAAMVAVAIFIVDDE